MKTSSFLCLVSLILVILYSCDKDKENSTQSGIKGQLISKSVCKNDLKSTGISFNQSCVEYSYDPSSQRLTLNHVNAAFNCCPDTVFCNIALRKDTIVIREIEGKPGCNCNCIYDLSIAVEGVDAKTYHVKFIEPYIDDQEKIEFLINLDKDNAGSFCVNRSHYPWDI